jgi:HD superfamily phosphohydrolase
MFDYLIDNNSIDIDNYEKKLIQKLILGEITPSDQKEFYYEPWIFEIVANKKNSIDVDKFDYICRDSYHIGLQSAFVDYDRIFKTSRIINNNLCFNIKNDFNILSLFQSRYKLFKQVYRHEKIIGIDLMIKDMLVLSDEHFKFTETIFNPEEYVKLDDHIIHQIEKFSKNETKPNLIQAANIYKRLKRRDIYKYVGEIIFSNDYNVNYANNYELKIEDLISFNNPKDENYVTLEDVEICKFSIDYGNGRKNPFDSIFFYKNENDKKSFTVPSNKISLAVPSVFMETYNVLVCKDPKKYERVSQMFKEYLKIVNKNIPSKIDSYSDSSLTPIKVNGKLNVTPRFTSNKRESEYLLEEIITKNTEILFNKIN